jgi:hypothetical protein
MENQNKKIEMKPSATYSWNPEDKIEITGIEYSIIQKTLAMFEPALSVSQAIFNRMLENGTAKEQGSPEPEDVAKSEPEAESAPEESVINPS